MAQEEQNAAADALEKDLNTFEKYLTAIVNADEKMAGVIVDESFPALNQVSENWAGGMAVSYIGKANTKMNELLEDCANIEAAATEIKMAYINNNVRPRLAAMGVDQETIDKSVPAITPDTATK